MFVITLDYNVVDGDYHGCTPAVHVGAAPPPRLVVQRPLLVELVTTYRNNSRPSGGRREYWN